MYGLISIINLPKTPLTGRGEYSRSKEEHTTLVEARSAVQETLYSALVCLFEDVCEWGPCRVFDAVQENVASGEEVGYQRSMLKGEKTVVQIGF